MTRTPHCLIAGLTLAASIAGLLTEARAADAALKPAADAGRLEDIVVTAQRREQSAQDIGIALTVISGDDLATRGVTNVNQLQFSAPGLQIVPAFGSGQPEFRLRGVGFDDYASNNTSTVGVYVNEVSYPLPIQTQGLLFDIDRVEVLRGPQGTLYGRNTTGGAINFITRKPTADASAGLEVEYGTFDAIRAEAFVSGPLADGWRARLSAVTQQGGGWQHDRTSHAPLGDANRNALRGQLEWLPSDRADVLLDAHYSSDTSDGAGLYLFRDLSSSFGSTNFTLPGSVLADADPARTGWGGSAVFAGLTGIGTGQKPFRDNSTSGIDLHARLDTGGVRLTSISAYESLDRREYNDWDASPLAYAGTFFASKAHVFSQELRVNSLGSGPLTWTAGLYYSDELLREQFASDFWQSLGFDTNTTYQQTVSSISGFGQIEYRFAPTLNLIVGVREEHERRALGGFVTAGLFAPNAPPFDFIPPSDVSASNNGTSGKIGLEWKPAANLLVYGNVSRGIKSGGFTAYNTPDVKLLHPIAPEKLLAYEVGFKNRYADDRVQLNGAAYYYDYKDQQVQSAIYTAFGPIGNIVNADSHISGAELELEWRPLPDFLISQSVAYNKGRFTQFEDLDIAASVAAGGAVYVSRAGQDQGLIPLTYSGAFAYGWSAGGYRVTAETNYSYRDAYKPVLLGPVYNIESYWLANASVTAAPAQGSWSVSLWVRNLTNTQYDLTRNFFLPPISIAAPGAPRTAGIRVDLRF
jgi:iron complex outermembrane receptor protein